jgi:hypothetical protein
LRRGTATPASGEELRHVRHRARLQRPPARVRLRHTRMTCSCFDPRRYTILNGEWMSSRMCG